MDTHQAIRSLISKGIDIQIPPSPQRGEEEDA